MKKVFKTLSIVSILALGLNAQTIHLEAGWNNVGLIGDTPLNDFNNPDIKYIWKYNAQDGKWYFYSNNEEYNNQVRQWIDSGINYYGFLTSLTAGDAIWVKAENPIDINVGAIAYTNIRGFVKNALTNEPINNFVVIIDNSEEKVFTDANGTFDIQNITVAAHQITVSAEGYNPATISVNIEDPTPVDLGQISLVPQQDANVELEVKGEIVNAVTGDRVDEPVRIRLFEGYNNTEGTPVIDKIVNDGYYDINVTAGSYTVLLTADGYRDTSYNYTFASDDDNIITQNFAIEPIDENVSYVLRATLTWGEEPKDLDSHFLAYDPNSDTNHSIWHIYYDDKDAYIDGEKVADLDVDDTDSFGPEHITLYDLNSSLKYVYYVWNYSGSPELKNSNADVKVYYNGQLYDFHVPYLDGRGWKVFEIENGVLIPCQTNCMVPDIGTTTINTWKTESNIINELIDTANLPK